jgi:3',5'-cyclic AMP phosphodiesterase CpdA
VLLAHLSDTHITTGILAGPPAERCYQAFNRISALNPRPHCALITGDLVDRGEYEEYVSALRLLHMLDIPIHVVPGNHDHASRMLEALSDTGFVHEASGEPGRCYYRVDYPGLRMFCCDSSIPGQHGGELGSRQLAWLDSELRRDPDIPAILAMHHHPVPCGIAALDRVMLSDARTLAELLLGHPPMTRILVGHLHRPVAATFAGSLVISAPSTYRQIFLDLGTRDAGAFVDEPAGILLHSFSGATAVTHMVPVEHSGPPYGAF